MTTATFNENLFLASVKRMNAICPNLSSEQTAKNFIRSAIAHCGYNKSEMFSYFKSTLETCIPDLRNKTFDMAGWKRIYARFIENGNRTDFAEQLRFGLTMAESADELELCFIAAADSAGYKGDLLLLEIKLDSIGWTTVVKRLVQVADEKGIEVPAIPVVEKKRGGRKRKETSIKVKTAPVVKKEKRVGKKIETATSVIEEKKLDTSHKSVRELVVAYYTDKDKRIDTSRPPIGTYLSQQEAADKLGVNKATISNYFRGTKSSVRWVGKDGNRYWIGLRKETA